MSRRSPQPAWSLLLFAPPFSEAALSRWLEQPEPGMAPDWRVILEADGLNGIPDLVIWAPDEHTDAASLREEARHLAERWQPAAILLILPPGHALPQRQLLSLPVQGLIVREGRRQLRHAVRTLLEGGRVIDLPKALPGGAASGDRALTLPGAGFSLLSSGLAQIDAELHVSEQLLSAAAHPLARLLLEGRIRELEAARQLLLWLWGPLTLAWGLPSEPGCASREPQPLSDPVAGLTLTLRQRDADGIWQALRARLQEATRAGTSNRSGQVLALDGLRPERRCDLLLALLEQFSQLREQLREEFNEPEAISGRWLRMQPELRRQALRQLTGTYVQLPAAGELVPVADNLLARADLSFEDPELPEPLSLLTALIQARPLLVDGRLLAPDEPEAVLYLEMLVANWLVRSAELVSAELMAACAEWPELRRYLLRPELLATRELERLRNQLNARQRWLNWVERPVLLYESRRQLFRLEAGVIRTVERIEPRDRELRRLAWPQQLVTLGLEARDAIAPQLQAVLQRLGDLLVVLLTKVVGRGIGLIGRGIVQGMGRSLRRQ